MSDDASTAVADEGDAGAGYSGVLGAYPYAFRRSSSRLFRSYVLLGGAVALLVGVLFLFAVVGIIAETAGTAGGTFSFARAFVILLGFLVVFPLMAPVILVARRHRRAGSTAAYDRGMAASGYLFFASLYLGLLPTTPPELRGDPPAALAPAVEALYGLPAGAGAVPPLLALAVGYLLHRRYR
jgi:hypothetical protein